MASKKLKIDIPILLPDAPDARDECVLRLIDTLESKDGIERVHVESGTGSAPSQLCIHYDPSGISLESVESFAKSCGATITRRIGHSVFEVRGIRHQRHAQSVKEDLKKLNGILSVGVSASGMIRAEFDRQVLTEKQLVAALDEMNLRLLSPLSLDVGSGNKTEHAEGHEEHKDDHGAGHAHGVAFLGERAELLFAIAAGSCLTIGFIASLIKGTSPNLPVAFYGAAYFFGGFFAFIEAVENLKAKRFEIDTLMIVAAIGAAALGKWAEGALLLALFSIGHALEHYAMGRAKKAIEALAQLAPKTAQVFRDGGRVEVKVEQLVIGDKVFVKPNERLPVDGVVVKGASAVNQAPVTGESMPVEKTPVVEGLNALKSPNEVSSENRVFAGTINGSGALEVLVTKLSSESTLARVAKMVAEAQAEASPTQQWTEKFEKYFVPAVLLTVVLLLFAFLVVSEPFSSSFYRAMAVLVAASPCALAISTPSAVLSGIARAGRAGVLIKGGAALENLGKVKAMAFDKTGTLTEGKPQVTDVVCAQGFDEQTVLRFAAAVEAESDHPLARAVVEGFKKKLPGEKLLAASKIESLTGRGIRAEVEQKNVLIGKPALFNGENGISQLSDDVKKTVLKLQGDGRTIVVIGIDDKVAGVIGVMDAPRETAAGALLQLRKLGVERLTMLSGDNQNVASAIAKQVGLTDAVGDLMPEDKVLTIKKLREENGVVAMVGDGVNDAPAMASASVGIAMGAAGSDVALETADVALMTDDLNHLAFVVGLSRQASLVIKQNLWISLGVVAVLIPATISGLGIGPAVAMHEGSTVVVVFNALRLLVYRAKN